MRTSSVGRAAITAREGRRLLAYRDSVGVWTIGVGHTGRMAGPSVSRGMRITADECDAMLESDLAPVERVLNIAVTVPMTQNEFDAMASLGFNIGVGGLKRSSVIRLLNCGDVSGAADAFLQWSKPSVLLGRRRQERSQFLKAGAPAVIAARGRVLASKAETRKTAAGQQTKVALGYVSVAVVGAALAAPRSHHHGALWACAALLAAGAVIAAVLAIRGRRQAVTLAGNADAHARAARALDAGTTDIVQALQQ